MDANLTRLCAIPGTHDLTIEEVAEVMCMSVSCVKRSTAKPGEPHNPALPKFEAKRPTGRGAGIRRQVRYSRAAVARHIVQISTGDRAAILAAVREQCPQFLPVVADLAPGAQPAPLPANVIPMRPRPKPATQDRFEHPDLFASA